MNIPIDVLPHFPEPCSPETPEDPWKTTDNLFKDLLMLQWMFKSLFAMDVQGFAGE